MAGSIEGPHGKVAIKLDRRLFLDGNAVMAKARELAEARARLKGRRIAGGETDYAARRKGNFLTVTFALEAKPK